MFKGRDQKYSSKGDKIEKKKDYKGVNTKTKKLKI